MSDSIQSKYLFNLRLKLTDINNQKLEFTDSELDKKLSSVIVCITPYNTITNTIEYKDSTNKPKTMSFTSVEDVDAILQSQFSDVENYTVNEDYESFEEILLNLKALFDYKIYSNKINFLFYLDYNYDLVCNIYQDFVLFIFKKFNGNLSFFGNSVSKLYFPNAEISVESLTIERFTLVIDKISTIHIDNFNIKNCFINGLGSQFKETDQLALYTSDTSNLENINIDSAIKIGITCKVINKFKWLKAELNLNNININFNTQNERHKPFDHIFKVSDFNNLNCINININNKLTKLIPFKIEKCGNINFFNYKNLFRDSDKKGPEVSFKNCDKIDMLNMIVLSENDNTTRSCAIHIDGIEDLGDLFISNSDFTNIDLLSMANSSMSTVSINDTIIKSKQYVFNIHGNNYIGDFSINNSKITTKNFELTEMNSIYLNNCFISTIDIINLSGFKIILSETEITTKSDINILVTGYELEQDTGSISLKDSVFSTPKNINFTDKRTQSKLIVDTTKLIAGILNDTGFKKVYYKQSKFQIKEGKFNSNEYSFTQHEINNDKISNRDKALSFTGLVSGSIIFENTNNSRLGISFTRPTINLNERDLLNLSFYSKEGTDFELNTHIENYCISLLLKSTNNKSGNVIGNFYIVDTDNKYLTTGNSIYKDKKSSNIQTFLKNLTAEKMQNVIIHDGTTSSDKIKLNFGIKK